MPSCFRVFTDSSFITPACTEDRDLCGIAAQPIFIAAFSPCPHSMHFAISQIVHGDSFYQAVFMTKWTIDEC